MRLTTRIGAHILPADEPGIQARRSRQREIVLQPRLFQQPARAGALAKLEWL